MATYIMETVTGLKPGVSAAITKSQAWIHTKNAASGGAEINSIVGVSGTVNFYVSVDGNSSNVDRNGTITVTPADGGTPQVINVGQYGISQVSLSPTEMQFDAPGNYIEP